VGVSPCTRPNTPKQNSVVHGEVHTAKLKLSGLSKLPRNQETGNSQVPKWAGFSQRERPSPLL
jgi:hypothetical protein